MHVRKSFFDVFCEKKRSCSRSILLQLLVATLSGWNNLTPTTASTFNFCCKSDKGHLAPSKWHFFAIFSVLNSRRTPPFWWSRPTNVLMVAPLRQISAPSWVAGVLYALVDVSARHRTRFVTRHSDDLVEQSEIWLKQKSEILKTEHTERKKRRNQQWRAILAAYYLPPRAASQLFTGTRKSCRSLNDKKWP